MDAQAMQNHPFANQLAPLQKDLLRYAKLQLRNDAWAEDVVSEVMMVALERPESFDNRSQLKTWLIGILKFKILDKFRSSAKEIALPSGEDDETSDSDALDGLIFKADGHFAHPLNDWSDPDAQLNRQEFFAVLEACMEKLPPKLGRLFLMREWLELSSEEICKEMALTPTNFYVQIHRAKLRLRECLDLNWYQNKP